MRRDRTDGSRRLGHRLACEPPRGQAPQEPKHPKKHPKSPSRWPSAAPPGSHVALRRRSEPGSGPLVPAGRLRVLSASGTGFGCALRALVKGARERRIPVCELADLLAALRVRADERLRKSALPAVEDL